MQAVHMAKRQTSKKPHVKTNRNRIARWPVAAVVVGLIAAIGAVLLFQSHAATVGSLTLSPGTGTAQVGSTLSVTVQVDSSTEVISTVEADLTYPANLLQFKDVTSTGSQFNDATPAPTVGPGTVNIVRASVAPLSGSLQFVTVNFTVLASGTANIGFASTSAIYRQSDVANLFGAGTGGTYDLQTINAPLDTTPPTITIIQPLNGATIRDKTQAIKAVSQDVSGIAHMNVIVDGVTLNVVPSGTINYNWSVQHLAHGSHTIMVKATDTKGNTSQSSITVNH
jgi:thermitase